MTLSIESMALESDGGVEGLHWKVSWSTVTQFCNGYLADCLLVLERVGEMVLLLLDAMVSRDEDIVIHDEATCNQGLPKAGNWFRVFVKAAIGVLHLGHVD